MYQFEATVYEDQHHPSCYAELWVGGNDSKKLLMSAHVSGAYDTYAGAVSHEEIMDMIGRVCGEIAENLEPYLF